jgi:hypothetical protein
LNALLTSRDVEEILCTPKLSGRDRNTYFFKVKFLASQRGIHRNIEKKVTYSSVKAKTGKFTL